MKVARARARAELVRWLRREWLEADTRGLALFRIAFGAAMLVYLGSRATGDTFVAFHTDYGVLPRAELLRDLGPSAGGSIFFVSGEPVGVAVLFGLCAAAMLAFTLGFATRSAAIVSLVALLSLHHRNPHIVNASMCISHLLALYSLALPLGRHYSIDAFLASRRGLARAPLEDERIRSVGVLAFRVQVAAIYFFNAVQKDGESWRDGSAVFRALHDDRLTRFTAPFVREHLPDFAIPILTYGVLVLELLIAVVALLPGSFPRRFACVGIVLLHVGIATVMRIGPFPVMMPCVALLLATSGDFSRVAARLDPLVARLRARVERGLGLEPAGPALRAPLSVEARFLPEAARLAREGYYVALFAVIALAIRAENPAITSRFGAVERPSPIALAVERALMTPQGWVLFAPDPAHEIGLLVVDMELFDGTHVDPLTHGPPDFERFRKGPFGTDFAWQAYQTVLARRADDRRLWDAFLDYLGRVPVLEGWAGERRVRSIDVYYVRGPTPARRSDARPPPERILLARRRSAEGHP